MPRIGVHRGVSTDAGNCLAGGRRYASVLHARPWRNEGVEGCRAGRACRCCGDGSRGCAERTQAPRIHAGRGPRSPEAPPCRSFRGRPVARSPVRSCTDRRGPFRSCPAQARQNLSGQQRPYDAPARAQVVVRAAMLAGSRTDRSRKSSYGLLIRAGRRTGPLIGAPRRTGCSYARVVVRAPSARVVVPGCQRLCSTTSVSSPDTICAVR
jgi:hypothetical protein